MSINAETHSLLHDKARSDKPNHDEKNSLHTKDQWHDRTQHALLSAGLKSFTWFYSRSQQRSNNIRLSLHNLSSWPRVNPTLTICLRLSLSCCLPPCCVKKNPLCRVSACLRCATAERQSSGSSWDRAAALYQLQYRGRCCQRAHGRQLTDCSVLFTQGAQAL